MYILHTAKFYTEGTFTIWRQFCSKFLLDKHDISTGLLYKAVPRLQECCRHVEAAEVSNSRNKVHQTWERPYRDSLYVYLVINTNLDLFISHSQEVWSILSYKSQPMTLQNIRIDAKGVTKDEIPKMTHFQFWLSENVQVRVPLNI